MNLARFASAISAFLWIRAAKVEVFSIAEGSTSVYVKFGIFARTLKEVSGIGNELAALAPLDVARAMRAGGLSSTENLSSNSYY